MSFSIEGVIEGIVGSAIWYGLSRVTPFVYSRVNWGFFASFSFICWLAMHWHYAIFLFHPMDSQFLILFSPLIIVLEVALFFLIVIDR